MATEVNWGQNKTLGHPTYTHCPLLGGYDLY